MNLSAFAAPLPPDALTPFVDPLPKPGVASPSYYARGVPVYRLQMSQFGQKLHRDLPETQVWGFNWSYPGPTIEARKDQKVNVRWVNGLPERHLLPVDKTIDGTIGTPEVRTVVHLHGGHTSDESDGHPLAWFTRGYKEVGPTFSRRLYEYDNDQPAATLWYHDHALGITRLNVYAGLAGFYLIRDIVEDQLNLPSGDQELPIAIQDRSFNADGSLFYPGETINGVTPSIVPEFFGNMAVVNGKVWPFKEVEPRKYRIRFLDGTNARFLNLQLFEYDETTKSPDFTKPGPAFTQIGTDGGLLQTSVQIDGRLLIGPGERADVIVDFSAFAGKSFLLHNNAKTPFRNIDQTEDEVPLPQIMLFRVSAAPVSKADTSQIPKKLVTHQAIPRSIRSRDWVLSESLDEFGRLKLLINGKGFAAPIRDKPLLGSTETWRFINNTPDTHPMHLHLVQFRPVERQLFDVDVFNQVGALVLIGSPRTPAPNENGYKDTVQAPPGMVTSVVSNFDRLGTYMVHCHILEHEDHDMMNQYTVVPR